MSGINRRVLLRALSEEMIELVNGGGSNPIAFDSNITTSSDVHKDWCNIQSADTIQDH